MANVNCRLWLPASRRSDPGTFLARMIISTHAQFTGKQGTRPRGGRKIWKRYAVERVDPSVACAFLAENPSTVLFAVAARGGSKRGDVG